MRSTGGGRLPRKCSTPSIWRGSSISPTCRAQGPAGEARGVTSVDAAPRHADGFTWPTDARSSVLGLAAAPTYAEMGGAPKGYDAKQENSATHGGGCRAGARSRTKGSWIWGMCSPGWAPATIPAMLPHLVLQQLAFRSHGFCALRRER
jgi:hypothetical protein